MASSSAAAIALVHRRLYRALLRAAKPFTPPSPNHAVLSSLLHRSFEPMLEPIDEKSAPYYYNRGSFRNTNDDIMTRFVDDYDDEDDEDDYDYDPTASNRHDAHFILFRRLLWTYFAATDSDDTTNNTPSTYDSSKFNRCFQSPHQILRGLHSSSPCNNNNNNTLEQLIRREFRARDDEVEEQHDKHHASAAFPIKTRRETAFLALRKLNEKLAWADHLETQQRNREGMCSINTTSSTQQQQFIRPSPKQAAKYVEPITTTSGRQQQQQQQQDVPSPPLLQEGMFLVAHPLMTGYFQRSVICILKYKDDYGAYGVIVNKESLAGKDNRTLEEIFPLLTEGLIGGLASSPVKDGGPVHMPSFQMLHASTSMIDDGTGSNEQDTLDEIGGTQIPSSVDSPNEKAVFFQGDLLAAAKYAKSGQLDRDDVSFFVGASLWYNGQLEKEIEQGSWLLCRGPADIALTGACEHEPTEKGEARPKADLWLSMMAAFGEDDAMLAHLVGETDDYDEYSNACDEF